jgi:hypothetical protein
MGRLLVSLALKYVTIAGAVVVTCAVARCLVHAARHATAGDYQKAAEETLGATVAPIRLANEAVASLVRDATRAGSDLSAFRHAELPARR